MKINGWYIGGALAALYIFAEEARAMLGGRRLSKQGLDFIALREGFPRNKDKTMALPYNDQADHCTIGIGHLLHQGRCTSADKPIPVAEALALFDSDVQKFVNGVTRLVRVPLAQHELDALVSFTFNVGLGAFTNSTLLRKLNAGDRLSVPLEMMKWVKITKDGVKVTSESAVNRRTIEGRIFAQGLYK